MSIGSMYDGASSTLGGVTPMTEQKAAQLVAYAEIVTGYNIQTLWGVGSSADHRTRMFIDIMVTANGQWIGGSRAIATNIGDIIVEAAISKAYDWDVAWIIWKRRIWSTTPGREGWRNMEDRGSLTQNHFDHPHIGFRSDRMLSALIPPQQEIPAGGVQEPLPDVIKPPTPVQVFVWDGSSFPGAAQFVPGISVGPWITLLGERLVTHGWTGYKVGPGPEFTSTDVAAVKWFQERQGWTGADADGIPGPETWRRLMANPVAVKPSISLSDLIWAIRKDAHPSNPTGRTNYPNPAATLVLERALAMVVSYDGPFDGSVGTNFVKAYSAWQRQLGYSDKDADGIPGMASLQQLAARTNMFTVSP